MKFNSAISKFLTNKWVLNVIAFLALFNVIGYLVMGNLNTVVYFIIFAILVRYFSKNMTIVLGVPLILVNLLAIRGNVLEGMESGTNSVTNPTKPNTKNSEEKINNLVNENTSATTSVINNSAASTVSESPDNPAQDTGDKQGFEPGRRKNRGYD